MYQVVKWGEYQSRSDRKTNPWVKLHRKFLESPTFHALSESARWQWFGLLALADFNDGVIRLTDQQIAFKLRIVSFNASEFVKNGLIAHHADTTGIHVVTTPLPDDNHTDTSGEAVEKSLAPRGEEIREEKRREDEIRPDDKPPLILPSGSVDHIGAIVPAVLDAPAADLSEGTVERILKATGDKPVDVWRTWWHDTVGKIDGFQRMPDLIDHIEYIEMCADPEQRRLKDLGELPAPGRWLTQQCCAIFDRYGQRLPSLPRGARNGRKARTGQPRRKTKGAT